MGRLNHINGGFRGAGSLAASKDEPEYIGQTVAFAQATAPVGWIKISTYNDHALRIVSGSTSNGGTSAFSTTFTTVNPYSPVTGPWPTTVGTTTISVAQMGAHTHTSHGAYPSVSGNSGYGPAAYRTVYTTQAQVPTPSPNFGAGGGHTHGANIDSITLTSSQDLNIKYIDVIMAKY